MEYRSCTLEITGDTYWVCDDVHLPHGGFGTFYLGPCGVYGILEVFSGSVKRLYDFLREKLELHHLRLYLSGAGLYDRSEDTVLDPFETDEELSSDVEVWVFGRRPIYKDHLLRQMVTKLQLEDGKATGVMTLEDGSIVVFRHGQPRPGSPIDSERIFWFTAFGGCFGLHRFALRKWLSGIVYLLTCGLFFSGWFIDMLSLFLSFQKDREKRYLLPLEDRWRKLLFALVGLAVNAALFLLYLTFLGTAMGSISSSVAHSLGPDDASGILSFVDWFKNLITP